MRAVAGIRGVRLLTPDDPAQACALGAMAIEGMGAQRLTDELHRRWRIHVRPRFVAGEFECIRVTPNVFTTLDEIDGFVGAIRVLANG